MAVIASAVVVGGGGGPWGELEVLTADYAPSQVWYFFSSSFSNVCGERVVVGALPGGETVGEMDLCILTEINSSLFTLCEDGNNFRIVLVLLLYRITYLA